MDPLIFEIRSISVMGLNLKGKGVSCFSKNQVVCVVVSIHGSNQSAKQKILIDKNGDTDPMFNFHRQFFTINPHDKQDVVIKLKENGFLTGKDIGQVRLSIKNLLENYDEKKGENHFSCYPAASSGRLKGELDIKYVFRELISYSGPGDGAVGAYQRPTAPESSGGDPPAAAAQPQTSSRFGDVVAGIGAGAAVFNALVGVFAS